MGTQAPGISGLERVFVGRPLVAAAADVGLLTRLGREKQIVSGRPDTIYLERGLVTVSLS